MDVTLRASYVISGQVVVEEAATPGPAGTANPTVAEGGRDLNGVGVQLTDAAGASHTVQTNSSGTFTFQGLVPGRYWLEIVSSSLPKTLEPVASSKAVVELTRESMPFVVLKAAPIPKSMVNTLGTGTFAMKVRLEPTQAPAGALVTVTVNSDEAQQASAQVQGEPGMDLARVDPKTFRGAIEIPKQARGVAIVTVRATAGSRSAQQTLMLFINQGPLADIGLSDTYVEPNQLVSIRVHVLTRATHVSLTAGGATVALTPIADRTYEATYRAPSTAGAVKLVVSVDGVVEATRTLTVTEGP